MTDPAPEATAPATTPPRRRLSPAKRALFALLPVVVLVGGTELFFRAREVTRARRKTVRGSPREPDAWRAFVLTPGAEFEEMGRVARINAYGMRDDEPLDPKPADVPRILCIGGSTTYGMYTSSNELTWPAQCERLLAGQGKRAELLNAGVPAWDLRTSQTNLELRLYDLRPDVVVACHVYNDLLGNTDPRYAKAAQVEWEDRRALWQPLHGHSALYRFLIARFKKGASEQLRRKAGALSEEGVAAFTANLRRLARRTRERGAKLVLATEPTCYRETLEASQAAGVPHLDHWYDELSPLEYPALIAGFRRYNQVVRDVARELGVPLCDLAAHMPTDVKLFLSPIHHSDEGEGHVAALVAKALVDAGLVR